MKQAMKVKLKKYSGVLYIGLMTLIVGFVLVQNNDIGMLLDALHSMRWQWVIAAGSCIAGYLYLRLAIIKLYVGRRGYRISWRNAAAVTGAGQFYSAITPSASGGQPMQVYYLHRHGVPASIGTACVSVKFLAFQSAYLLLGGLLWLLNREAVAQQLSGMRWLVVVGFIVNSALIVLVILTAVFRRFLQILAGGLVRLGSKIRLVRQPERIQTQLEEAVKDYCAALRSLAKSPGETLAVFLLTVLQVLLFMSVPVCLYHAFGLSGASDPAVLTVSNLLFVAAAFVPLPGAAGAQETGFYVFFSGIFPEPVMAAAMISWRFFSYYLLMIAGLGMMAVDGRIKQSGRKENENADC